MNAKLFRVRHTAKDEFKSFSSFTRFSYQTTGQFFIAILFALACLFLDPLLKTFYLKYSFKIPDDSDYVTFLAAIGSISGVFIGLYFAAISSVSGAIYATVPNNIRDLLTHERLGNVYMRFLAFLTFLSLILIALHLLGKPRLLIAIPLLTILSGIGIISFVKLGQQAFYFFDPATLSGHIFEQLQYSISSVKVKGYRWNEKSFQHHAYRQASKSLDTLETLSDLMSQKDHLNGASFLSLTRNLIRFLSFYELAKRSIPTNSNWYEEQYTHNDWYRSDDSRVSIAHATGTTLQPEVTTDKLWIEKRAFPLVKKCIEINLTKGRYSEIFGLVGNIEGYIKVLAQEGEVQRAFELVTDILNVVVSHFESTSDGGLIETEILERLSLMEQLVALPISIALSYHERLKATNKAVLINKLEKINWAKPQGIYLQEFPTFMLERLEWFIKRMNFELSVEGEIVTPLWYKLELANQTEADQFLKCTGSLINSAITFYRTLIQKAIGLKNHWVLAALLSREWEYWHKIGNQIDSWPATWEEISMDRRIDGLPWGKFDFDDLQSKVHLEEQELLAEMSKQNMLLALISRPEGYPDFAGQFLHTSGEVALDAILANDVEMLKKVFEPYLLGCLLKFDSLRPTETEIDWRFKQNFKVASAALLDVMDVSGYAKVIAEYFDNNALWVEVENAWKKYFSQQTKSSPITLLIAASNLTEEAFEIPFRGILRTNWQRRVSQKLADIPRRDVFHKGAFFSDIEIEHKSPLVKLFAGDRYGMYYSGVDVFIGLFLYELDTKKEVEISHKSLDLYEKINDSDDNS